MADDKIIRCDCGYRLSTQSGDGRIAEVRRHAREAHGISFSTEEALAVLLRVEFEVDEAAADLTTATDSGFEEEER